MEDPAEKEKQDCIRASKAVNGTWVGVDFIAVKDRDKDGPYILEVNSSPGTEGFDEATGKNITKLILENFKNKENWWKVSTLAGVGETFEHKKLGKMIGKMDTGNSSKTSVIHADTYEIKGKKINWELNGVKMTSQIEEMKKQEKLEDENITEDDKYKSYINPDGDFTHDDIPF